MNRAATAPWVRLEYIENAILAEQTNSLTACAITLGSPCPPNSAGAASADPAALGELLVGRLEPGRRRHAAVGMAAAAFLVADAIERGQHVLAEFRRLAEHGGDQIRRRIGEAGQVVVALDMEDVGQQEHDVVDRSFVARHDLPPLRPQTSAQASRFTIGRRRPGRRRPRPVPCLPVSGRGPERDRADRPFFTGSGRSLTACLPYS